MKVFDKNDCIPFSYEESIEGKVAVIDSLVLKEEFQNERNQLVLITGGNGAYSASNGNVCIGIILNDEQRIQCFRDDLIGTIPEENLPDWAKERLANIREEEYCF